MKNMTMDATKKILILNDMGGEVMYVTEHVTGTLREQMKHHEPIVCYAIEGNVVDRKSNKNGKGWCEDVSPTLDTQDRHAVIYALEGNGSSPSHSVCYAPELANCTSYKESDISATLCTKYHYGNGGDAAIVLNQKEEANESIRSRESSER